eukprot:TRINITY_DN68969_c0_g1_i1.p1 TRINITY_DN68969_c0_g1~~TRINITY_DN68969_c0_g1_i1.p1  ORF type:complete len:235 (+),score=48.90 TRINITY_DN68969_c0_g1_i1:92-706(+)
MAFSKTCILLAMVLAAEAVHPRPKWSDYASYARWLVHESDYATVSEHHGEDVFGNIVSVSDGLGYEQSTGIIYTYLPTPDVTYQDLMKDSRVSLTFSEKALAGGESGGCANTTAEDPPCGRLVIQGRLTLVPPEHVAEAEKILFSRHPTMKGWDQAHMFRPFWMAKENITGFFLIDMYGGAQHPSVDDYLKAPWHANSTEQIMV